MAWMKIPLSAILHWCLNGLDILDIGIDEDTSLNEQLVTEEGAKFLAEYYDKLISESEYDVSIEEDLLSSYYSKFKS